VGAGVGDVVDDGIDVGVGTNVGGVRWCCFNWSEGSTGNTILVQQSKIFFIEYFTYVEWVFSLML
jgi:hypothetical protein